MDLNEIAIFIKVVQVGSFSQAARALSLPNSTVSFKISMLEKRLGVTLIKRTTRKLNITEEGQAFYERCVRGLEEIQAAEEEVSAIKGEPYGLLKITAPLDIGNSVLPAIVSQYRKKFPKVSIELILTDRRVDLLGENIDLAIRAGVLKDSSLVAKRIGSTFFVPVASAKYLKEQGTPLHPKDLLNYQCIQFTPFGLDGWNLVGPKGKVKINVPGSVYVNQLEMIRTMSMQNDGIAFLPHPFIYPDLKSGKLVRILPEWRSALTPVHFIYPAQRFVNPKLRSFIEFASKGLKEAFSHLED